MASRYLSRNTLLMLSILSAAMTQGYKFELVVFVALNSTTEEEPIETQNVWEHQHFSVC